MNSLDSATGAVPDALAVLPLLYLIWADGNLTAEEIDSVRERIQTDSLTPDCRRLLQRWLDPSRPPTARVLNGWLKQIRDSAGGLDRAASLPLAVLSQHLTHASLNKAQEEVVETLLDSLGFSGNEPVRRLLGGADFAEDIENATIPVAELTALLDGEQKTLRQQMREQLCRFDYVYGLSRDDYREQVLNWCRELARQGWGAMAYPVAHGGRDDRAGALAGFEILGTLIFC